MRTAATAGRDGIIFRIFAGTSPIPIVMWPAASTEAGVVCARVNCRPTSGTSGHLVQSAGCPGTSARTGQVDVQGQASFLQARVAAATDQAEEDEAARASFQPIGLVKVASGEDGAAPTLFKATAGMRSGEVAPGRRAPSAIEAIEAWEEAASVEAEVIGVAGGEDKPRRK
jgi:hypothetical protein